MSKLLGGTVYLPSPGLRQEYATTSSSTTASRRSSSFSLRCSEMDLDEEEEDEEGYNQLPPPQPRLLRTGSMQWGSLSHSHTFSSISSIRECSRRSTSTPQYSLSGLSQYQQQFSGPSRLIVDTYGYRSSTGQSRAGVFHPSRPTGYAGFCSGPMPTHLIQLIS